MLGDGFVRGRANFSDHLPGRNEPTAKIYIKVRFADFEDVFLAQLDTGAAWSILTPKLARMLGVTGWGAERIILSTRFGTLEGHLVRIPITIVAAEGESLDTDGMFFVSPDWPIDQTFLGYSGLLDSIRFALDPQANHFYFGAS
jgi:hypothetical protein